MKLNKKKFYMMLQMCRNYWEKGGDTEWLGFIINIGEDLEKETRVSWVVFVNIAHQMARLNVNDTNCHKIMELFGFELE